jgi:hypothetical protein
MEEKEKPAVYVGRRINGDDVVQMFLLEDNQEIIFKGIKGVILGCTYSYKGNGKMSVHPVRWDVPHRHDPKWDAQDKLAEDFLERKRANARAKANSSPAYAAAVRSVQVLVRGLSLRQREALINKIFYDVDKRD